MKDFFLENDFYYYTAIEDKALFSVKNNSQIVEVRAVDEKFPRKKHRLYFNRWFGVNEGGVVIGWGLALELGISPQDELNPATLYIPKPGKGQIISEEDALRSKNLLFQGLFYQTRR